MLKNVTKLILNVDAAHDQNLRPFCSLYIGIKYSKLKFIFLGFPFLHCRRNAQRYNDARQVGYFSENAKREVSQKKNLLK